jgi:hypothetical protein
MSDAEIDSGHDASLTRVAYTTFYDGRGEAGFGSTLDDDA